MLVYKSMGEEFKVTAILPKSEDSYDVNEYLGQNPNEGVIGSFDSYIIIAELPVTNQCLCGQTFIMTNDRETTCSIKCEAEYNGR